MLGLSRLRAGLRPGSGVRQAGGSGAGPDRAELSPPVFVAHRPEPGLPPFASLSAPHRYRGAPCAFLSKLWPANRSARVGVASPVGTDRSRRIDAYGGAGILFFAAGADLWSAGHAPCVLGAFLRHQ